MDTYRELKDGDVLFRIPEDVPSRVRFGSVLQEFVNGIEIDTTKSHSPDVLDAEYLSL